MNLQTKQTVEHALRAHTPNTHSDLDDKPFEICLNYAIDHKYILKLENTEFVIHSNKTSIKNAN